MMGTTHTQTSMFHYTSIEQLVPADDPLRAIEAVIDWDLIRQKLASHYSETGRPSIAAGPPPHSRQSLDRWLLTPQHPAGSSLGGGGRVGFHPDDQRHGIYSQRSRFCE